MRKRENAAQGCTVPHDFLDHVVGMANKQRALWTSLRGEAR